MAHVTVNSPLAVRPRVELLGEANHRRERCPEDVQCWIRIRIGKCKSQKRNDGKADFICVVAELAHRDRPRLLVVALECGDDATEHGR